MNDRHDPDPAFLAHLERETRFALRRAREDRGSAVQSQLFGRLRSAALAVLSLGLGAGVVLAAQELEDRRWSERRLARNAIECELAEKKLEVARVQERRVAQLVASGLESNSVARDVARRVSGLEREALLLTLEREELQLGGRPPERHDDVALAAPLVRGRDFVSERLRATREALVRHAESLATDLALVEQQVAAGFATIASLGRARVEHESAGRALATLDQKLVLRADFVVGLLSAGECERAAMLVAAEAQVAELAARVELARDAFRLADTLHTSGYAPASDAERIALAEVEAELALAELELAVLR